MKESMYVIKGNLVELAKKGYFDVIVQGCNCFNTMGAGIAKQIKKAWPEIYAVDCKTVRGDKKKLGTITVAYEEDAIVVNAYTQYYYGTKRGRNADYDAIRSAFRIINDEFRGMVIGIPRIGAGLAGGDWNIIKKIIVEETPDVKVILVLLP